jgi:hypothetical protein
MGPYRAEPLVELSCPRCGDPLPPLDVAACTCGTWLTALAASEVLTEEERRPDRMTRWWRIRAPCPICGDQMLLRGSEPGLFQGCDGHGYWIDADTVEHTGLGRGVDHEAIDRKRNDPAAVEALREERERAELERAAAREQKARAYAASREAERAAEARRRAKEVEHRLEIHEPGDNRHAVDDQPVAERIAVLEARNAALEARVAALEAVVARMSPTR